MVVRVLAGGSLSARVCRVWG